MSMTEASLLQQKNGHKNNGSKGKQLKFRFQESEDDEEEDLDLENNKGGVGGANSVDNGDSGSGAATDTYYQEGAGKSNGATIEKGNTTAVQTGKPKASVSSGTFFNLKKVKQLIR